MRAVRAELAVYRSWLLLALLILTVGCASHGGMDTRTEANLDSGDTSEEKTEMKAPPFFIYRPGAGLTIEGSKGDWRLSL